MRLRQIAALAAALLCLLGLVLVSRECSAPKADYAFEAAEMLPEDTVLIFSTESINALLEQSSEEEVYPGLRSAVEEAIDWDSSRWDELEELGFRLDEPVFFALLEIARPVALVSAGFEGDLEGLASLPEISATSPETITIADEPALLVDEKHIVFIRDDRLFAVGGADAWFSNEPAEDLREIARRVAERDWDESAGNAVGFNELMRFERETDAALFINVAAGLRQLMESLELPLLLARSDVTGLSVGLADDEDHRYVVQNLLLREGSRLPDRFLGPPRSLEPLNRIPGPLSSGAHMSVDTKYLLDLVGGIPFLGWNMRESLREAEWFVEDMLGTDVDGLTDLLTGELGLFARHVEAGTGPQVVFFAGVNQEAQARAFVAAVAGQFFDSAEPERRDGVSVFSLDTGDLGVCAIFVLDAYLWATCGAETTDAVLSGSRDSFLEDEHHDELFAEDVVAAAYLDVSSTRSGYGLTLFDWYLERGGATIGEVSYSIVRDDDMFRGTLAVAVAPVSDQGVAPDTAQAERRSGETLRNPLARSELLAVNGWHVEVVDVERSDDVSEHFFGGRGEAEQLNLVSVQVRVTCTGRFRRRYDLRSGQFGLVGARGVQYPPAHTSDLAAEIRRDGSSYVGERTVTGHLNFVVPVDAQSLILVAERDGGAPFRDDRTCRFLAIDDGASVVVAPVTGIEDDGAIDGLVPLGQSGRQDDWELEVMEVFRGETARLLLVESGGHSFEPSSGQEYIAARVRLQNVGDGTCARQFSGFGADLVDGAGERIYTSQAYAPGPPLEGSLFPGAEIEGWLAAEVPEGQDLHLSIDRASDRGFSLTPSNLTNPFSGPGFTRENPFPLGSAAETLDWRYTVLEVIGGSEAVSMLQGQSSWFRPSPDAETVLVKVRVENRGSASSPTGAFDWEMIDSLGERCGQAPGSRYRPRLDTVWPDDGQAEGWLTFEVESAAGVVLMLDRPQRRFLALE